ncbi:MAG: hypothetical protein AMXMBFR33_46760 [Candidatus Xenobia bacterium]
MKGWTLVEALVAMALASIIFLVVAGVLHSTSRVTRIQTQRSLQQTRLQAIVGHLEKVLIGCSPAGVSWRRSASPDAAVLAAHCYRTDTFTSPQPRWEALWRCFVWDASTGQLYLAQNATPVPSDTRPQAMTPGQLDTFLQSALPGPNLVEPRLLASRVTDFRYTLEPGPLFRVEVEVDVPVYDQQTQAATPRLRVVRQIHPRNQ